MTALLFLFGPPNRKGWSIDRFQSFGQRPNSREWSSIWWCYLVGSSSAFGFEFSKPFPRGY